MTVAEIKKKYLSGMNVMLLEMDDIQAPPTGTKGIVQDVDDMGTIHVKWENGSTLGLIPGVDRFELI